MAACPGQRCIAARRQTQHRSTLPIIVPCHRVVAHGGKLGGFTGGVEVKRALLEIEGHRAQHLRC